MDEGRESGESLVNDRAKQPPCSKCGCTNHTLNKCVSRKHADGTMLHNVGEIEDVEYKMNNKVSIKVVTKNGDLCCHIGGLSNIHPT